MSDPPFAEKEDEPEWSPKERAWAHELPTGIAAALALIDPPEKVDEALLGAVLRQVATRSDELGDSLFLRSLADALDNPLAQRRLTLSRARRGRPDDALKVERALTVGPFVAGFVAQGWKKEAAIQKAMSELELSRSAVLRACSEYQKLRPALDSIQVAVDAVRKRRSK